MLLTGASSQVKCDRATTGCRPCFRLDLRCSFIAVGDGSGDEGTPLTELTQAGFTRRRTQRACTTCRSLKAKCSGDQPCGRCRCYSLHCTYAEARSRRGSARQELPEAKGDTLPPAPVRVASSSQFGVESSPHLPIPVGPETPDTVGGSSADSKSFSQ